MNYKLFGGSRCGRLILFRNQQGSQNESYYFRGLSLNFPHHLSPLGILPLEINGNDELILLSDDLCLNIKHLLHHLYNLPGGPRTDHFSGQQILTRDGVGAGMGHPRGGWEALF